MMMMMQKKTATAQNLIGYIVTSSKDSHLPPRILRPRYISTPHVNYQYYKQYLEENSLVVLSPWSWNEINFDVHALRPLLHLGRSTPPLCDQRPNPRVYQSDINSEVNYTRI